MNHSEMGPVRYARGRTISDNHPTILEAAGFAEFTQAVLDDRGNAKGEVWISAPFNHDGRRCRENVQPRRFLPVDLDKIAPEILPDVRMRFAAFSGFGYATASSTPDAPRERAVIELSREVSREEGIRLGAVLMQDFALRYGGAVNLDASVFRSEQCVYTPLVGAPSHRFDGEALDVDAWLARAPEAPETPRAAPHPEGCIPRGQRSKTLTSFAGSMRRRGMGEDAIAAALLVENGRCDPPLPEAEVRAIAKSVSRYEPAGGTGSPHKDLPGKLDQLRAFLPLHRYIDIPTNAMWPAASVDRSIPAHEWPVVGKTRMAPSHWLDQSKPVHQLTWHPGEPKFIKDRVVDGGGWVSHPGNVVMNQYRPPVRRDGDPAKARLWRDLLRRLYPETADHIEHWFAHRVQRPGEKLNHAIVLGGMQGIGKDSLLEPIKEAVGDWNLSEVSPEVLMEPFNPHVKSVIIRVSEARDLGEVDKFSFYERVKTLTANPPATLRVNEKYVPAYQVFNLCSIVYTTNNELDCLYLPADDRRHHVSWSEEVKENFAPDYWVTYYRWLDSGGHGHVAAYLRSMDLSSFDPKAPPPKTAAFYRLVQSNRSEGDSTLTDVLEHLGNCDALTLRMLSQAAEAIGADYLFSELADKKARQQVPHRLNRVGYVVVPNPSVKQEDWKIGKNRLKVYARRDLSEGERLSAAERLVRVSS